MARADGRRDQECTVFHGYYVPSDDIKWVVRNADVHVVYLYRLKPGNKRRTRVRIGEVRRSAQTGRHGERCWRAFPERVDEFPELCGTHRHAMAYLKFRWEAGPSLVEPATRPKQKAELPRASWPKFFGEDPFGPES